MKNAGKLWERFRLDSMGWTDCEYLRHGSADQFQDAAYRAEYTST